MRQSIEAYFETLEGWSTDELDRSVEKLARVERRHTALVIAHIAEISRRKAALERGYKNTFDYCVRRLNFSEGAVALRLQVANVVRRFPQLLAAIAEGRVSLTVAGLLAPHLTEDNVETLLSDCAGMTKRSAEAYLVALRPKPVFEPSIRKLPAPASPPAAPNVEPAPSRTEHAMAASSPARAPESAAPSPTPSPSRPLVQPATPERFNFRFAAGREFKEKLERLAEVLGVENLEAHLAEVLETAVDVTLERNDPQRKLERRRRREARRASSPHTSDEASSRESRPDEISNESANPDSRYLPSEVRERVHERAGYRCEFRSADGTRCTSRTGLQIEHVRPFAIHRSHDERFLRLFCPSHNRLTAERVYGKAFIEMKIARRAGRGPEGMTAPPISSEWEQPARRE